MKNLIFLFIATLRISSCAKNETAGGPKADETVGSRDFKIQSTKNAFKVSLFGVFMAAPDYHSVLSVIEQANSQGSLDRIVQFENPIEGGIAHCIEVANQSVRTQLLEDLKNAPTSLRDSFYTIESVDDCSQ